MYMEHRAGWRRRRRASFGVRFESFGANSLGVYIGAGVIFTRRTSITTALNFPTIEASSEFRGEKLADKVTIELRSPKPSNKKDTDSSEESNNSADTIGKSGVFFSPKVTPLFRKIPSQAVLLSEKHFPAIICTLRDKMLLTDEKFKDFYELSDPPEEDTKPSTPTKYDINKEINEDSDISEEDKEAKKERIKLEIVPVLYIDVVKCEVEGSIKPGFVVDIFSNDELYISDSRIATKDDEDKDKDKDKDGKEPSEADHCDKNEEPATDASDGAGGVSGSSGTNSEEDKGPFSGGGGGGGVEPCEGEKEDESKSKDKEWDKETSKDKEKTDDKSSDKDDKKDSSDNKKEEKDGEGGKRGSGGEYWWW